MPKGWETRELGSFMEFKNGINADKEDYGVGTKFVNVMDIFSKSYLRKDEIIGSVQISEKSAKEYSVVFGDILFNRTSETPEDIACASVYLDADAITFGGFVIRGRQKEQILAPEYCRYVFNSMPVRRECIRRGQGAVRANIGQQDLAKVPVQVPPLAEQKKIAEILVVWDEAIEKLERLRCKKELRLEGLIARMVHGSDAKLEHLRTYISEVSERNRGQKTERILSVTNSVGFVLAEEQFAHRVASADVSNYKIVRQGQYAYNPSRINVGSIARLDKWEDGALSPMYVVFETRMGLDSDYFLHWLRSAEARQRIALSAQGSVRETVSFGDFSSILIPIPPIDDQRQIAQALNLARDEIALIDEEITALQRQKRGLMQKLLTGEWRVQC